MSAGKPIEYIGCYSMAPWEPIEGGNPQGFVSKVQQFGRMAENGDFVARTFLAAWEGRYGKDSVPDQPLKREYPNTALLLRTAFSAQEWDMRLHDIRYWKDIEDWCSKQSVDRYRVQGDWTKSSLIRNAPMSTDRPVLTMLDPYQIVDDSNPKADDGGYLPTCLLRYLFGSLALDAHVREKTAEPCVNLMFSYSQADADEPDRVVRTVFPEGKWAIERVQSKHKNRDGTPLYHQGWIVTKGVSGRLVEPSIQEAWNQWASGIADANDQQGSCNDG
jgi:hypothetical protein